MLEDENSDTIKQLLMIRLKANEHKNLAMSKLGKKPLSLLQREKIELTH